MKRSLSLPVAAIGAVVLGVAGFGAGFAVRAADNDNTDSPSSSIAPANDLPAPAIGIGSNNPGWTQPGRDVKVAADGGTGTSMANYGENDVSIMPACTVDLPVSITGAGIDLAAAGFVVKPLGSGFVAASFSVRSMGDCVYAADGTQTATGTGKVVVDTTWRHVETGIQVTVSQQVADDTVVNALRQNQASFTDGGYSFHVYANNYYYYGAKDGIDPAISSREAPAIAPGMPDPRVEAVLAEAVKDLAPGLSDQCFAREVQGDWADLAKFGLGDPRPALPSGVEFQNLMLIYTNPAAADCGGAALTMDQGFQFSANWYSNDKAGTNVSIYAGGMGPESSQGRGWNIGQISENSATWQSRNIAFNVYGNSANGQGLGVDTIRAIAKALDPSFDEACFMTESTFKGSDLSKFGIKSPVLPGGYKLSDERGVSYDVRDGCETPEGYIDNALSYWSNYENGDGNIITIGLDRSPYGKSEAGTGYISPGNVYFVTADGVNVSISGYNKNGGEGASLDDLKAIGKSIDPSVDYDSLNATGGGSKPMPMPAPADTNRSTSGG